MRHYCLWNWEHQNIVFYYFKSLGSLRIFGRWQLRPSLVKIFVGCRKMAKNTTFLGSNLYIYIRRRVEHQFSFEWAVFDIMSEISKESVYYAGSKYIILIKFSVTYQRLRAWENLLDLRKKEGGSTLNSRRILIKITPSYSAYQKTLLFKAPSSYLQKCGIF